MKVSEVIVELQELLDKTENGDCEFGVYLSFSKKTIRNIEFFYDEKIKDICVGVYV